MQYSSHFGLFWVLKTPKDILAGTRDDNRTSGATH
jgi:hypothetical protein